MESKLTLNHHLEDLSPELKAEIFAKAASLGLTDIDSSNRHTLWKIDAKVSNPSIPDEGYMLHGYPTLVGTKDKETGEVFVWLAIVNLSEWYKTSPIIAAAPLVDNLGFSFETRNSFYKLVDTEKAAEARNAQRSDAALQAEL